MSDIEQLEFIRNGGETRRYHTVPVLRQQTVAEHSYHVAMIVAWLAGQEPPGIGANLLMAALVHDLAEHKMGDLPAPVKRSLPAYDRNASDDRDLPFREVWDGLEQEHLELVELNWEHTLTLQEQRWLKLADAAEGCFYCIRERAMGNQLIAEVFRNFQSYVAQVVNSGPVSSAETELTIYISNEWRKVHGTA